MSAYTETWPTLSSSSPATKNPSKISKVYRQASTLFLTRRLPESLTTLLPVLITYPETSDPPPVFNASKTTRVKVWSLYLTILNAICELAPDEGKQAFGTSEFRALVSKVRDGAIWDEVVRNGYGGLEGDVDTDVVINLATLLLAHARNQKINQQRLESYLASISDPETYHVKESLSRNNTRRQSLISHGGGADTSRELNSLVKILELYTLHVLLRNNEWEFSREVITVSSILDEDRREAFLQALQSLQDEQKLILQREREEQLAFQENQIREAEEAKRIREIEQTRLEDEKFRTSKRIESSDINNRAEDKKNICADPNQSKLPLKKSTIQSNSSASRASESRKNVSLSLISRTRLILLNVFKIIEASAIYLKTRPRLTLETLIFVLGLLILQRQRNVRDIVKKSWIKVKQTAVMGGKVSHI